MKRWMIQPIYTLLDWLDNRKLERARNEYGVGYGWAWSEYMVEGRMLEDIESDIDSYDFDQFDRGAAAAIEDIVALSVKPKFLASMSKHGRSRS